MKRQPRFELNRAAIRAQARASVGDISAGQRCRPTIRALNEVLSTQLLQEMIVRRHLYKGMGDTTEQEAFLSSFLMQLADNGHQIAEAIVALGGSPDFSPSNLSSSIVCYYESDCWEDVLINELAATQVLVGHYRTFGRVLSACDPSGSSLAAFLLNEALERGEHFRTRLRQAGIDPAGFRQRLGLVHSVE